MTWPPNAAVRQRVVQVQAGADPAHAAKYIKSQAKYIASQAKWLHNYNEYWAEAEPGETSLSKAAKAYGGVAKLYELIDKIYND